MQTFQGRVAVVTGGASGIGLAMCSRFAAAGMRIVMADLPGSQLQESAETLRASGAEVLPVAADVSDWESVRELAGQVRSAYGAAHVLCNNAGIRSMGSVWETTLDDWRWVMNVNLMGVIHGIKAFVPDMIARGEPSHIVNTASVAGLLAYKGAGPYSASKAAVVSLSEVLFQDLAETGAPVRVSVLCPGSVPTRFRQNSNRLQPSGAGVEVKQTQSPGARSAEHVAECVFDAVLHERFWILSNPGYAELVEQRARGIFENDEVVPGRPV